MNAAIPAIIMVAAGILLVPAVAQAQGDTPTPMPTPTPFPTIVDPSPTPGPRSSRDCKIVGHDNTVHYLDNDDKGDDHRSIEGATVDKVIFRKDIPYSFTLAGKDCPLGGSTVPLWLFYQTVDSPRTQNRGEFINIEDKDDIQSYMVMAVFDHTEPDRVLYTYSTDRAAGLS